MIEPYYAKDRRVYNGAPCSDMKKEFEHRDMLLKRLMELDPDAHCTYFPMEGKFLVFSGLNQITGNMHDCKQIAIIEAIQHLEVEPND